MRRTDRRWNRGRNHERGARRAPTLSRRHQQVRRQRSPIRAREATCPVGEELLPGAVPPAGVSCLTADGRTAPAATASARPGARRAPAAPPQRPWPGERVRLPVRGRASETTHTASVGVPEQSRPLSTSAWTFASVAVATAFTRAASVSTAGDRHHDVDRARLRNASAPSPGRAAQPRTSTPAVTNASAPASRARAYADTSAAVIRPTPGLLNPASAAREARCSGSVRR